MGRRTLAGKRVRFCCFRGTLRADVGSLAEADDTQQRNGRPSTLRQSLLLSEDRGGLTLAGGHLHQLERTSAPTRTAVALSRARETCTDRPDRPPARRRPGAANGRRRQVPAPAGRPPAPLVHCRARAAASGSAGAQRERRPCPLRLFRPARRRRLGPRLCRATRRYPGRSRLGGRPPARSPLAAELSPPTALSSRPTSPPAWLQPRRPRVPSWPVPPAPAERIPVFGLWPIALRKSCDARSSRRACARITPGPPATAWPSSTSRPIRRPILQRQQAGRTWPKPSGCWRRARDRIRRRVC